MDQAVSFLNGLTGMRATTLIGHADGLRNRCFSVRIRGRLPFHARVVQLADTAVSKTVFSPFESEREYQTGGRCANWQSTQV
ncbi:MAG: hypothetical protein QOH41_2425 [Blastocatellia bacterium]|nr:hypothetical protein [Blastocatellia bacterium]